MDEDISNSLTKFFDYPDYDNNQDNDSCIDTFNSKFSFLFSFLFFAHFLVFYSFFTLIDYSCLTDEDYLNLIRQYIYPKPYEWIFIFLHLIVFFVGLGGNFLICVFVYRNHSMRTVTNYFIVNLAIADFLVILICLPPTVLWDATKTWFLGNVMCKIVRYFQGVSVSVSILTLTFISIDRWYAICHPLKFKSTTAKARVCIIIIWIFSLIIVFPDLIILTTKRNTSLRIDTHYLTDCDYSWNEDSKRYYQFWIVIVFYLGPITLMSIAYYQIAVVLWNKNIPGDHETIFQSNNIKNRASSSSKHNCNLKLSSKTNTGKYFMLHLTFV